ncbi:MAG: serine--tRNA ligase, partial [Desertifilum sp. SIO1I2]|nr:serine--tRNA ligase [Desertifilum sp. SIO1I2]
MLDIKQIRDNFEQVQELLNRRGGNYDLQPILEVDNQQRELETQGGKLRAKSNEIGKLVGEKIKSGTPANSPEVQALKDEGNQIKAQLAELEPKEKELQAKLIELLLPIPNLPSEATPIGKSEEENVEVRRWGDEYLPKNENILPHWEIGEKLGILNFERSVKIAQSRFVTLLGAGAALERALISFMLNRHLAAGYTEVSPPYLINSTSLTASGQLPKFAEESFKCDRDDLWLTPTAEVPVTSFYRDEILPEESLPVRYCAYTPCFRREAGSYG